MSRKALLVLALAACESRDGQPQGFSGSIDAYESYIQKSKASEGAIGLRHLVRALKEYWMDRATFPGAPAGPTPPVGACCGLPGDRCPAATQVPEGTWRDLDLAFDSPFRFSYWYEVVDPAREVVVHAIGDLDCDGITSDLAARLTVTPGGDIAVTMTESRPDE